MQLADGTQQAFRVRFGMGDIIGTNHGIKIADQSMFLQCLQSPGAVLSRAKAAEPACILDVPKQFLHAVYHLDQMNVFSGNPPVMLGHAKRQAHLGKNVRYGIPAVPKEFLKRRERTLGNQAKALEKGFALYFQ
ncbi:hypothetical protein D3C74_420460 [compost metagenome]